MLAKNRFARASEKSSGEAAAKNPAGCQRGDMAGNF
jgi:hypothetical protein